MDEKLTDFILAALGQALIRHLDGTSPEVYDYEVEHILLMAPEEHRALVASQWSRHTIRVLCG